MAQDILNYEYERLVRTLVRMLMRKYEITRISEDDLFQEGMLALLKAEKTFQEGKGAKFETYASRVINNHLIDVMRTYKLDPETEPEPEPEPDPYADVRKSLKKILREALEHCSEFERAIFSAYYQGYSYQEICEIFEISKKKVDNTIQKIHRLARSIYAD